MVSRKWDTMSICAKGFVGTGSSVQERWPLGVYSQWPIFSLSRWFGPTE